MKVLALLDFVETPTFALVFPGYGQPFIAYWNRHAEQATGLSRTDVVGHVPTDVMGSLAEPLLAKSWATTHGEVTLDGLGLVNLKPLPDQRTVICTVKTATQMGADKEREMFLGLAIHDARAPLRNISYLCEELLTEFPAPADGRNKIVRQMRAITERTLRMSDEILTSVQAASMQFAQACEVELQSICDLVFATLDPTGQHRLVAQNSLVQVERPVLQVILRNLIDNAIQHASKGRSLAIEVRVEEAGAGMLHVQIEDDGNGFSDASLAFFASGEVRRGGGFGLYGVRRLLEARGGQLQVARSAQGSGSVVTATLPGLLIETPSQVARAS